MHGTVTAKSFPYVEPPRKKYEQASQKKPEPERVFIAKTRQCLKCRDDFKSEWEGNRLCERCKAFNEKSGGISIFDD